MPYKQHKQYRLQGYNYSAIGDYFITICTKNRKHHFGRITKINNTKTMKLSAIGLFVNESILSIPNIYEKITLGETVVMPNHIHLIITLPRNKINYDCNQSSLQQLMAPHKGLCPLKPGSVSSIINHFKGKVTKWCNANEHRYFNWQLRFHDHIIRNEKSYNIISNYIAHNIYNWDDDENNEDGNNFRKDIRT